MKNLLTIIFILLIITLFFEGGFYFGINFSKNSAEKQEPAKIPQISISPTRGQSDNSVYSQMTKYQPKFKSATGANIKSTPAIPASILGPIIFPLMNADKGFIEEASISYKIKGVVIKVEKGAQYLPKIQGIDFSDFYNFTIENPQTSVTNSVFIDSKKQPKNINDYVGKLVEIKRTSDLINNQNNSIITIISPDKK